MEVRGNFFLSGLNKCDLLTGGQDVALFIGRWAVVGSAVYVLCITFGVSGSVL